MTWLDTVAAFVYAIAFAVLCAVLMIRLYRQMRRAEADVAGQQRVLVDIYLARRGRR